ncbi:MAG: ParM/StbA family protein [Lachnospiraceae bacterium]|nr:ParM/StbA family protein [Lachnospiraceae bacterium]MBR6849397.1 ParM/StbA family protein [Lachnospiraceae bacterium]
MDTRAFKTKSEIREYRLPKINGNNQYKGRTVIALDGGYSSVKGASPCRVFMFPSYAKRVTKDLEVIGKVRAEDIQYRDNNTGEIWLVGQNAETMMTASDVASTTDTSLYTRYRYNSDIFRVIMATGMCLGLWGTGEGNEIFLQTGLPAEYKDRDTDVLVDALSGDYNVSIKIGNSDWATFSYTLDKDHIGVMEQPMGTLCALTYKDGITTDLGKRLMRSQGTMIFDVGFGTEDIFSIMTGYKNKHQTHSDTGMRAVFEEVINQITQKYPVDVKIFEFQKYLDKGVVSFYDQSERCMRKVPFEEILDRINTAICEKSMDRLMQEYNMGDYEHLVVTGGTGESRFGQIKKYFADRKFEDLQVLPGNLNTPDLPFCYSNVIGYYMFRHAKLMAELKKEFPKTEAAV